ncbi:MAG: DNA mismatch repair endonuclease MutL, partial [candidate division Zixibacteria bacterium]|nr:DNA mismatch repair endonuclease MutL [candidate division Zixibacteria bacterium]
ASKIEVVVEGSGLTKIEVHDNGHGITGDQIEIAFRRHATSKIGEFSELEEISAFGFRGEALPSIASVSRLRLISKSREEDHANEIRLEGGVTQNVEPSHRADGTTVIVEDLFFNTPVRRKFLKAESTESRHILRALSGLAFSSEEVAFSLTMNGRKSFGFSNDDNLTTRAASILGVGASSLMPIEIEDDTFRLYGVLGKPEVARGARGGLYFIVNERALKSSPLSYAVSLGYGELLPKGVFPVGVVRLIVDRRKVDVNVHPAKSEVRLSEESQAHKFIRKAIKETLRQAGIIAEAQLPQGSIPSGSSYRREFETRSTDSISETEKLFGSLRPRDNAIDSVTEDNTGTQKRHAVIQEDKPVSENSVEISSQVESHLSEGFKYLGQFSKLYLIAQSGDSLYLIDQHAAHERILYEELMVTLSRSKAPAQRLMFPINVELSKELFLIWEGAKSELEEIGFEMTAFGGETVMLNSAPAIIAGKSPQKIFRQSLEDIERLRKAGYTPLKAVAQSVACRSAVMSGDALAEKEATKLVETLLACDTAYSCPHGRPTFIKISRANLDKQFGRA